MFYESTLVIWAGVGVIVSLGFILYAVVRLTEMGYVRIQARRARWRLASPQHWADVMQHENVSQVHQTLAMIAGEEDLSLATAEYTRMFFELQEARQTIRDREAEIEDLEIEKLEWAMTADKKDRLRNRYLQKNRRYKSVIDEAEAILLQIVEPIKDLDVPPEYIEYNDTDTLALELDEILGRKV